MILIERKKEKTWLSVQSLPFTDEAEIQSLLLSNPELLPLVQFGLAEKPVRFFVKEVPLEAGFVDLLGFSEDGSVTIVECKLARNDEARRTVIGQLLDYASDLYQWTYEELQEACEGQELSEGHLEDDIAKLVCKYAKDSELSDGIVRSRISKHLREGAFRLVVVVDGLPQSLKRIVSYIGRSASSGLNLCLLELQQYCQEEGRIIVPILHGRESIDIEQKADEEKLNTWWDILRQIRERLSEKSLPHKMRWYPLKKVVGKSYDGYYISATIAQENGSRYVNLWAEPEGLKLWASVSVPEFAFKSIGPILGEMTGRESEDWGGGEVGSIAGSWSQLADSQFVDDMASLFLQLCEKFGDPSFQV